MLKISCCKFVTRTSGTFLRRPPGAVHFQRSSFARLPGLRPPLPPNASSVVCIGASVCSGTLLLLKSGLVVRGHCQQAATPPSVAAVAAGTAPVSPKRKKQKKRRSNAVVRAAFYLYKWLSLGGRLVWIAVVFGPLLAAYPLTHWSGRVRRGWQRLLLRAVEISGPTFIKLGQWASTRRDLFSPDFCDLFSKLHLDAPRHYWYQTEKKLERSFGKHWRDVFVRVEASLHSGCVGQVYKGYMRLEALSEECQEALLDDDDEPSEFDDGREILKLDWFFRKQTKDLYEDDEDNRPAETTDNSEEGNGSGDDDASLVHIAKSLKESEDIIPVAIKVLHPGIYRRVQWDLQLLRVLASCLSILPNLKWLSLPECVEEFDALMRKQIDLRIEANNLDTFVENFNDVSFIRFPRPLRPFVSRDVLVETYEEGDYISTFINSDDGDRPEGLNERLAAMGIDALLKMIFADNFVHADLHPGNLLVQGAAGFTGETGNILKMEDMCDTVVISVKPKECPLKLVMLDTGIVASLSDYDRQNFRDVFTNVLLGKGEMVAELFLQHTNHMCPDETKFKADMAELVISAHQQTVKLGMMQVGTLLEDLFSLMIKHKVKLNGNFASIMLAIMVLEGLGRSLDPNLDILDAARPMLLGGVV